MIRCSRCLMPSSRPDIRFREDGVCSACDAFDRRLLIDWAAREQRFRELMLAGKTHPIYDCIVASSGGKDSHHIALKIRELGHRPLILTVETDFLTEVGRRNRENLERLGFDTIEFTPNVEIRRRIIRRALMEVGDPEWAEHALIFSQPVRFARDLGIGLVLYGESPQNDLSGGDQDAIYLDKAWRERYGGLLGLRPSDIIGTGITATDMAVYEWPDHDENIRALFLGQFYAWDGWLNARSAEVHGFEPYRKSVEGNIWDCENLDNGLIGIHYYLAYLKFGFGRATTTASLDIRHGRLTRDIAISLVREVDGNYPERYMGMYLDDMLDDIGMTRAQFDETCDRFANKKLLDRVSPGHWVLKPEHAL